MKIYRLACKVSTPMQLLYFPYSFVGCQGPQGWPINIRQLESSSSGTIPPSILSGAGGELFILFDSVRSKDQGPLSEVLLGPRSLIFVGVRLVKTVGIVRGTSCGPKASSGRVSLRRKYFRLSPSSTRF